MFEFTYQNYGNFIQSLDKTAMMKDAFDKDGVILRHDIDVSPFFAEQIGRIEYDLGVQASYFFLVSSPYYNIMSNDSRVAMKILMDWGHEIGLHYDQTTMNFENEVKILEGLIGEKVKSVSLHCPMRPYPMFEGYVNAYDERIFGEDKYISDSQMHKSFVDKNPFDFVKGKKRVQVLLHPCQFSRENKGFENVVERYLDNKQISFDTDFGDLYEGKGS